MTAAIAAPPARPELSLRLSSNALAVVIITLVWARTVLGYAANSLTTDKTSVAAGEQIETSAIANLVTQGFFAMALAVSGAVIVFRITRPGLWRVTVMLVPWLWMVTREAYSGNFTPDAILYLFLVLALAALRPDVRVLAAVGGLVVVTAILAIGIGVAFPESGIVRDETGEFRIRADKEFFPGLGLLQGMFFSENTLGQFLAIGAVSLLWIRPLWLRLTCASVVGFAILWSASRSALVTVAVAATVGAMAWALRRYGRAGLARLWMRAAAVAALTVMCVLPLLGWDDDAFSARGIIWSVTLEEWSDRAMWFGFGLDWYTQMALNAISPLHAGAVSGHNDLIHMLATGGILLAVAAAAWMLIVDWDMTRGRRQGAVIAGMLVVATLVSGTLEIVVGFVNGSSLWPIILAPICVMFFAPIPPDEKGPAWLDATSRPIRN